MAVSSVAASSSRASSSGGIAMDARGASPPSEATSSVAEQCRRESLRGALPRAVGDGRRRRRFVRVRRGLSRRAVDVQDRERHHALPPCEGRRLTARGLRRDDRLREMRRRGAGEGAGVRRGRRVDVFHVERCGGSSARGRLRRVSRASSSSKIDDDDDDDRAGRIGQEHGVEASTSRRSSRCDHECRHAEPDGETNAPRARCWRFTERRKPRKRIVAAVRAHRGDDDRRRRNRGGREVDAEALGAKLDKTTRSDR